MPLYRIRTDHQINNVHLVQFGCFAFIFFILKSLKKRIQMTKALVVHTKKLPHTRIR